MSFDSRSVQFVGESICEGDDTFEATSRGSGPSPPAHESGRRWSLHQAARQFLPESSREEEEEKECGKGSSQGEGDLRPEVGRVPLGTRGSRLSVQD
ncbi:UNVERIFIED_CONTAM: hypothetical protein Sradi_0158400 [Sesamum radiatum]|uniref:Uncharacterized protein n=1 Tax=Sesamum radiatum TaxID=300843 RepID=A0AAW2WK23_SESRA